MTLFLRGILPTLLATLTRQPRYIPAFEWSRTSWTHNAFRAWESLFGRRHGIRCESSAWSFKDETGTQYQGYAFYTLEAALAHLESVIRGALPRRLPVRVFIPRLQTTAGFRAPASPFLFAIALDTSNKQSQSTNTSTTCTLSYTTTGSNPWMGVGVGANSDVGGDVISSVTYNGTALTQLAKATNSANQADYYYYLASPATGAHNLVATRSTSTSGSFGFGVETFSGVDSTLDASGTATLSSGSTSSSVACTVVAANCWLAGYRGGNRTPTAGTQTTNRQTDTPNFWSGALADSNGTVGTGSQALSWTSTAEPAGSDGTGLFVVSIKPVPPTQLKTWDAVSWENIKSLDGIT